MDMRDLGYFEKVAELGHLGKAATKVYRTQPALTKSIQRLEAHLGADLFKRSGRQLKLTAAGEVLFAQARQLRRAVEEAEREVSDVASGAVGHVRVGTAATVAEFLLPQLVQDLLRERPGVTMEVVIGMNDVLRAQLREGSLDLVIGPVSATEEAFEMHPFIDDVVVVAARKGHPLLRGTPRLQDLCNYGWVLSARSVATRKWLDHVFERNNLPPPRAQIESNSISLMPPLIAKTDLLSFISRRNLGTGKVGAVLREIPLKQTTMKRQFGAVLRRGAYLSPASRAVVELVKKKGEEMFRGG